MEIGTAEATAGERDRGVLSVAELPTGPTEQLPVAIVNGAEEGPTVWIHGAIHGDEATGLAVGQDIVDHVTPTELAGTIVSVPMVNPAGVRRNKRTSYYHGHDPNRQFPTQGATTRPPRQQALINQQLFELIEAHADVLLDLHTAGVDSMPFLIRNRISYGDDRSESAARELSEKIDRLAAASGLPLVLQYEPELKSELGLDKSTTNVVTNRAGIPALTVELGAHSVVNEAHRKAGLTGIENVLKELGVQSGAPVANDHAPSIPVDFQVCRDSGPRVGTAGIVRFRCDVGEAITAGQPVADIVGPAGEHRETVTAQADGFMTGRREGVAVYENDRVASMATRDESDLLQESD